MVTKVAVALVASLTLGLVAPASAAPGKPKAGSAASFAKKDKDKDGGLTRAEFAGKKGGAGAEAKFGRLDKNNDGKVSLSEMESGGKAPKKAKAGKAKKIKKNVA